MQNNEQAAEQEQPQEDLQSKSLGFSAADLFKEEMKKPKEGFENPEQIEIESEAIEDEQGQTLGEELKKVDDEDLLLAKAVLIFIDETRANGLSIYAHGNIKHTKKYTYYSNDLEDEQNQILLRAISIYTKKWRLGNSAALIIVVSLVLSTIALGWQARQDKQSRFEAEEEQRKRKEKAQAEQERKEREKQRKKVQKGEETPKDNIRTIQKGAL